MQDRWMGRDAILFRRFEFTGEERQKRALVAALRGVSIRQIYLILKFLRLAPPFEEVPEWSLPDE